MARLGIEGEVLSACALDFDDLTALPEQVDDIGAEVPGRSGGGVRLRAVLARAGLKDGATHVTLVSTDGGFSASVPIAGVRDAIVAYRHGGRPIPVERGGPIRFYVPDAAACDAGEIDHCANVKFLGSIRVTCGAGDDTRPTTAAAHRKLHESS